jgi:hypothetical protein
MLAEHWLADGVNKGEPIYFSLPPFLKRGERPAETNS